MKILRVDDTLPKELFEKLQRADKVKVAVWHSNDCRRAVVTQRGVD